MLQTWNLVCKYKNVCTFWYQGSLNVADVSIFFAKNQHFMLKIIPLLKAIVWELYWRFCSSVFSFCKINGYCYWKCKFYRLHARNPASGLLQIGHKTEKWESRHNFPAWRQRQIFLTVFLFLLSSLVMVQVSCQYHH